MRMGAVGALVVLLAHRKVRWVGYHCRLQDEIKRRVQTSAEDMHAEQRRSSEAREALNELTREIDGMANSLEAEKARAGSLSAALSTTRDMVQNLKAEASEKDEEIDRLARRAAAADEEASRLSRSLSTAKEEAQRDAQQIAAELESAREVADQMSSRITALEQEVSLKPCLLPFPTPNLCRRHLKSLPQYHPSTPRSSGIFMRIAKPFMEPKRRAGRWLKRTAGCASALS